MRSLCVNPLERTRCTEERHSAGAVRPVEIGYLWSWEEEESFTLEICIEGNRLLYSETSHEHKGGTIRIAVRFVGPCEKQCPRSVLVLRGETQQVDHCRIKEYLANHSGYPIPQSVQAQGHGLIEDEVGRDEPPLKRLKQAADACMVRVEAIDVRKPGTGIDKGVRHQGHHRV
jgi:hypothetical protein